ncbi:hypothetical protein FRC98_08560 [Lujinxingia vulgaris]|uniref:Uncharacterized protein n=1 Tax=Lujinxingia vulgaris TaxID=2600176 RepID=A0A5C6X8Q2_9DELT|nr:hypothetical protein [Lujinxingia vulgaris]TXD37728.1 hypothetical protein FRC98_08560 [Lujinxingia vulgaris]
MRSERAFSLFPGRSRALPLLVASLLTAGLGGCVVSDDDSPVTPPQLNVYEPAPEHDAPPSNDDALPVDDDGDMALRGVESEQVWGEPQGPRGGDFAEVWATSGGYYALERGAHRPASLWRSERGEAWSQVATTQNVANIREVVAHRGVVFAFGESTLRSQDGETFEVADLDGVRASDVLAARVFDDALYLSLRDTAFSSRLARIDDAGTTVVAENLPTLAGDFIIDDQRVLITEGSYHGGIYRGQLGSAQWTLADTPEHAINGGVDLHRSPVGYLATSNHGTWRSEDGTHFEVALHQEAPQAAIADDSLYFGPLEPWGYVAHITLDDLAGERANASVSYLEPIEADDLTIVSDGNSVVSAAMGAGIFLHGPGGDAMQNVSPLLRPLRDLSTNASERWALSARGALFIEDAQGTWQHLSYEHEGRTLGFERIASVPGALFTITRDNDFVSLHASGARWIFDQGIALGEGRSSALELVGDSIWAGFAPMTLHGDGPAVTFGGGLFVAQDFGQNAWQWSRPEHGLSDLYPGRGTPPVYALLPDSDPAIVVGHDGIFLQDHDRWVPARDTAGLNAANLRADQVWLTRTSRAIYLATTTSEGSELRRSLDGGDSWALLHDRATLGHVTAMEGAQDTVFIATDAGVFSLFPNGELRRIGADAPPGRVSTLSLQESTLFAATNYGVVALNVVFD